jgi:tetratricopeptide (TPR) repeat protein
MTDAELGLYSKRTVRDQTAALGVPSPTFTESANADLELRRWLHMARQVDAEAVRVLQAQTENIRLQDRRFGAAVLRDQITGHVRHIDDLLRHATLRAQREPLAKVLSDAASLAAWQSLDLGLTDDAWRYFELSKSAAREANNEAHYAYAAGEQAYVLLDVGHVTGARDLLISARDMLTEVVERSATRVPERLRCWLYAATAETHAALGDELGTRRAMAQADRVLPEGSADPDLPFLALDGTHLARWRGNCLAQLGDAEAMTDLRRALQEMDESFIRAGASLRCDIATALLLSDERDEAAIHIAQARDLAAITDSVRQRRRIERLASGL